MPFLPPPFLPFFAVFFAAVFFAFFALGAFFARLLPPT